MNESSLCHILVVDDEPDLEDLMRQRMRREVRRGVFQLEFAQNGREALNVLRENPDIEIVLSDINMPVMDGLTLLDNIPSINAEIKAVMVSAYGDMKNIRSAMNRGAFDFVTKPVDFEDLKTTINRTSEAVRIAKQHVQNQQRLISIQSELDTAAQMQQSVLPKSFPSSEKFNVFGNMVSAREVGGDFFDVRTLGHHGTTDEVGLCIADVSGKGITASLFMMSSWTLMRGAMIGEEDPSEVVSQVNDMLEQQNESMMFVTLFYGTYKESTKELVYSNAGHNNPVIFRADGSAEELEPTAGIALGVIASTDFGLNTIKFESGDMLVMYTDGVNEAERADESLFGMERLKGVFDGGTPPRDAEEATERVFDKVREFTGSNPQSDDITCLVLCVT